jgi:hypothetical protein
MKSDELLELMHEVLDGAASAKDSRKLDQLLSQDRVARAEYEDLRRLFTGLNTMPKQLPPEDLLSRVTARIPPARRRSDWRSQLFSRLRVLQLLSKQAWASTAGQPDKTRPVSRFEISSRNDKMSTDKGLFTKRIVWIGAGVAAAAVVVATRFFDIPPNSAIGTIVPAQRFEATQPGAGDVNGSVGAGSTQAGAVIDAAADRASADRSSADRSSADRSSADRSSADRSSADRSSADRSSADRSSADRSSADRSSADRLSADRSSADRSSADRSSADRSSADRSSADRSSADRSSADRSSADRSSADRSSADRSSADRSSADRSSADRSSADRSSADRSSADRSSADRASADRNASAN